MSRFAITANNTLLDSASKTLLTIVDIVPVYNIFIFRLNISIRKPAQSFDINEKKTAIPSMHPNCFVDPCNCSTI